ncbi:MAG: hypothetical protein U0835_12580 [Isosphaeraceae bacterium]
MSRGFVAALHGLIPYGPGPFHLDQLDPRELDDVLNDFADGERFGSREEVDEYLRRHDGGIIRGRHRLSGLGERTAYIEKQHREIEEPLSQEVEAGSEANVKLMSELLYGGDAAAPPSLILPGRSV